MCIEIVNITFSFLYTVESYPNPHSGCLKFLFPVSPSVNVERIIQGCCFL